MQCGEEANTHPTSSHRQMSRTDVSTRHWSGCFSTSSGLKEKCWRETL